MGTTSGWGRRARGKILSYLSGEDITLDEKLIDYDILAMEAHSLMLWKVKILKDEDLNKVLQALEKAAGEHKRGKFILKEELEDVHMNLEQFVISEAGEESGRMIHMARSRNDQVQADTRMYLREATDNIIDELLKVIRTFIVKADEHLGTVMPGYTHTRPAQPITFAHWCLAHADAFFRDVERLEDAYKRINLNPLGAGAIAGVGLPIDRSLTTSLLGFDGIQENTLDVVTSRGEMESEFLAILSILMVHLSRIAEDIILWSTHEFRMITLDDHFTTWSSLMPQKKNPDVAELIRGRVGRLLGDLVDILSTLKGLPSGYNRDTQETKSPLFRSVDLVRSTLKVMDGMLDTMKINGDRMLELSRRGFATATDLVDFMVTDIGVPFRTAYNLVSTVVEESLAKEKVDAVALSEAVKKLTGRRIRLSQKEIEEYLDPIRTVERRRHIGGPSPQEVSRMIKDRETLVKEKANTLLSRRERRERSLNQMRGVIQSILKDELEIAWETLVDASEVEIA